ncbi:MAG: cyclic nucleotide-binding domain-containing protein, partial [Planctomycetota bacterium]
EVTIKDTNGESKRIAQMEPGEVFGEVALVSEEKRTADVVATSETKVLKLEWSSLETIRTYLPMISSKLFLNISRILGERFANQQKGSR